MTIEPPAALVNVFADLRIDVDGQATTLTGDGRRLTFTTPAPQRLLNSFPSTRRDGLRTAGRIADLLDDHGLQLRVVGPSGEVARLGAGVRSRWGSTVVGSSRIEAGSVRTLGTLAVSIARGWRFFRPAVAALAVVAVAAAAAGIRKGASVISDRH